MAKKARIAQIAQFEEENEFGFGEETNLDLSNVVANSELELSEIPIEKEDVRLDKREVVKVRSNEPLYNCLRNERVIVRHIPKKTGMVSDPKHVLYGGMAETAKKTYTVPVLRSGLFVDVLTNDEKRYLERAMGLEANALSVYNRENNFWSTANDMGIASVELGKQDNYLDLSNPTDYIKYKILLANKNFIAPSLKELQDRPKATYEFVIVSDGDSTKAALTRVNTKKQCYKELGKIEDDYDIMKLVVETLEGRPIARSTKIDFLQAKADDLITANAKSFLKIVQDPQLATKVLIRKAVEHGLIVHRGNFYYLKENNANVPMCEDGQEPTFNIAALYLDAPKRQELKFSLEAKVKN